MTEFEEYLRGTFEINNGIENDVDTLVRIHAPELLELAKKELMKDAVKGQVERGYCEDGISEHFEVFAYLSGRDERFKDLSDEQSVKVIIIKE